MTVSRAAVGVAMDGSQMQGTFVLASLITYQMLMAGFVPSMYRVTFLRDQNQTLWVIFVTNYESLVSLSKKKELPTSFLRVAFVPESLTGNGVITAVQTNTLSTLTLALRRRLTYWVSFIKYLC